LEEDKYILKRHPGLVPGSTAPRVMTSNLLPCGLLPGGSRHKAGMTNLLGAGRAS